MKKIILTVAVALVLVSCGQSSKKGAWSQEDKDKFNKEMEKVKGSLDVLGDKKQAYIDCYWKKVEANYENFEKANSDVSGCQKLAMDCATEAMK